MKQTVFGRPISAVEVERLPADRGPTDFVRLCGVLIGRAMADRLGSFTLPAITERISVPDGGVDAEYTPPEPGSLSETGGLVGPGTTVYQFKYRDPSSASRARLVSGLARTLRSESPKVAPRCDRYVLMTNVHLEGAQVRRLRDALVEGHSAFAAKMVVVWGAAEIALALNSTPYLRHLFFADGGLCTLDYAEEELKRAYRTLGWPEFVNREGERAAIETFLEDLLARTLLVTGPRYVGKTRLVIEALKSRAASVFWAASPEQLTFDHFRDIDSVEVPGILVVDGCADRSAHDVLAMAEARARMKTIVISTGPGRVEVPAETGLLAVGSFNDQEALDFIAKTVPRLSFLQQSWLREATDGNPGLILHACAVITKIGVSSAVGSQDIQTRLGALLEKQYASRLTPDERQAIEVASLLTVVGVEGEVGKEVAAVCAAVGFSADAFRNLLPQLERAGLVRRRGRFAEVVPPLLAEHLASQALASQPSKLAELLFGLPQHAVPRFLARLRDLPGTEVRSTIGAILSEAQWFPDLKSVLEQLDTLRLLAPAAPSQALCCLERTVGTLTAAQLREDIDDDDKGRTLVSTLEDVALRSDTFEGATKLLLTLAEAENESYVNNATDAFTHLFHWDHPQVPVNIRRRLEVLKQGVASESAARRRVVAQACRVALAENIAIGLRRASGADWPEPRYRAETWDEVREYAGGIVDLLVGLEQDGDPEVRQAALSALLGSFRTVVRLSVTTQGFHELGVRAFEVLGRIARSTQSARIWSDVISQLEWAQEDLSNSGANGSAAARQGLDLARKLLAELTGAGFRAQLWRWLGPPSRSMRRVRPGDEEVLSAIESLASTSLQDPASLADHLSWLMGRAGREAKRRATFFEMLGRKDRDRRLFELVVARSTEPSWHEAFSAYLRGWFENDPEGAEAALDNLMDARPDLAAGVLEATCSLPISGKTAERLLRLLESVSMSRSEVVREAAKRLPWDQLKADDMERLIRVFDSGDRELRVHLLDAFECRLYTGAGVPPALRELAWSFLDSAFPPTPNADFSTWNAVAAALGKDEPERLTRLLEEVLTRLPGTDRRTFDPVNEIDEVLETLQEQDRPGLIRMLLRLALDPKGPHFAEEMVSRIVNPSQDRDALLKFVDESGVEGARLVALYLGASEPGFWEVARDLLVRWGDDDELRRRLLLSLSGWGRPVPKIQDQLDKVGELAAHPDSKVAAWAREAESELKNWLDRARREDREGWIWDYRVSPGELEAMLQKEDSPQRLWAIGRLLQDAPKERVLELLTPAEILDALPRLDQLDERTRQTWGAYARHWSHVH